MVTDPCEVCGNVLGQLVQARADSGEIWRVCGACMKRIRKLDGSFDYTHNARKLQDVSNVPHPRLPTKRQS